MKNPPPSAPENGFSLQYGVGDRNAEEYPSRWLPARRLPLGARFDRLCSRAAGGAVMNMHDPNGPMLSAALEYAAMGWEVFPAPLGQKKSHKSEKFSGAKWGKTT